MGLSGCSELGPQRTRRMGSFCLPDQASCECFPWFRKETRPQTELASFCQFLASARQELLPGLAFCSLRSRLSNRHFPFTR